MSFTCAKVGVADCFDYELAASPQAGRGVKENGFMTPKQLGSITSPPSRSISVSSYEAHIEWTARKSRNSDANAPTCSRRIQGEVFIPGSGLDVHVSYNICDFGRDVVPRNAITNFSDGAILGGVSIKCN